MNRRTSIVLAAATITLALAGCTTESDLILDPHGDVVTQAPYDVPNSDRSTDQPGADPDVSDQTRTQPPTPVEVIEPHDDPAAFGLTDGDERASSQTAIEFLQTVWNWDSTDTSDRAGLERALPLATPELVVDLQTLIATPQFTPEEWATLAGQSDVGSLVEVIAAMPVDDGTYDASTYTVRLIYNTYIRDSNGAPLSRAEDARYATLVMTRTDAGTWLVSALPHQDAEQIIETSTTLP